MKSKLIIIDGVPGSGKSTLAQRVAQMLNEGQIPHHCILEQAMEHPLFIRDRQFNTFEDPEEADLFRSKILHLFKEFAQVGTVNDRVVIIESVVFQDMLGFAYNRGMERQQIIELADTLQELLRPLNPILVYISQADNERHWRYICSVRGAEWGPVSLHTDEDFREAGKLWSGNQSFMLRLIENWAMPKLLLHNEAYDWEKQTGQALQFVKEFVNS